MSSNEPKQTCDSNQGWCGPKEDAPRKTISNKPIEMYTFIDPLCPECWAFEPIVKKLQAEYGSYLTIRYFVANKLEAWNYAQAKYKGVSSLENLAKIWEKTAGRTGMSCDGDLWLEDPVCSPYTASLAIKAAEMQGKQAGARFLRKLREYLFLNKKNVSKEEVLLECANDAGLDVTEFSDDLHSEGAIKALLCDMKTTKELEIDYSPSFVFFNDRVEDDGLKVVGIYPYEVYVHIIRETLGYLPEKDPLVPLEDFLARYKFVATKEVSVVYDISVEEAERRLRRLLLEQKVERIPVKYGTFWRYVEKE
ncbi:ClpXP adapter SpxH family protein [Bacillus alkalicellulosilyticus]|uniref:ClpXP adapter SpxH family protein n=1 Tax=Alkalihalobacterium alkalicellulosilyticum TaxID=1912214 RepID=UPI0009975515|nr:ClpXP adapter SpxH family protein [Bacillus alkalicellulosilyticus]